MIRQEIQVPSCDGQHTLRGVIYIPDNPRAILHVVHGMTEYIGRYEGFFSRMALQGYVCFGYDHLGHGHTAEGPGEYGYFAPKDGARLLVEDVDNVASRVRLRFPGLPYYLMGHSMGSFVVRLAAEKRPPDKLIVMGTAGPNPAAPAGLLLAKIIRLFKGEKYFSPWLKKLTFGSYCRDFAEENDPNSWLTREKTIRERYAADPLCSFQFTVSGMCDLVTLMKRCNRRKWFYSLPPEMPLLLVSGDKDPVGNRGKGVIQVAERLEKAGKQNVTLHLYPECRHELLNETDSAAVEAEIISFLEA